MLPNEGIKHIILIGGVLKKCQQQEIDKPSKSVRHMPSKSGNLTVSNLSAELSSNAHSKTMSPTKW